MLKNNKSAKFFMVMSMVAILSGPLLNTNLSSSCNNLAGTASVSKISNLSNMSSANDLQVAWAIFDWKIWGYVGQAASAVVSVAAVAGAYFGYTYNSSIAGIMKTDFISTGLSSQQETIMLLQDLN